ncbi:DUF4468 domain-containing protein [Flavobacterium lindanitolerans]|uniref:DUF4468 domain-containing protein n=1 Tax=Flavobacterium lindanitolerans TaxID=428988 RepID=UPI0027BA018C|nr:DUF4468 domain-containing protein [Flavobacterium lindanitolerans]
MKIIFLFLISCISAFSQAQTGKLIYGSTVQKEGRSKEELYLTAKMWFATEFKNSVVQDNETERRLSAEAFFEYQPSSSQSDIRAKGRIKYTVTILVKDGQYEYDITDFRHEPSNHSKGISVGLLTNSEVFPDWKDKQKEVKDKIWKDIKNELSRLVFPVYLSLNEAMNETNVPNGSRNR